MDAVPRISRAQSLDVLSLDGQHRRLPRGDRGGAHLRPVLHRPGDRGRQGAAGEGAGRRRRRRRAGRDRRRAAASGAIVRATDVRPEVAEQVRSLGGDYVAVPAGEQRSAPTATRGRWARTSTAGPR